MGYFRFFCTDWTFWSKIDNISGHCISALRLEQLGNCAKIVKIYTFGKFQIWKFHCENVVFSIKT